jgi:hypothetical protein
VFNFWSDVLVSSPMWPMVMGSSSNSVVCSFHFCYYYNGPESLLLLPHKRPNVTVSDDGRAWNCDRMSRWRSGKAPNLYECRPRHRLSRGISWHSSVPPGECRDNALIKPRSLSYKSFSINRLSENAYCSMLYSLASDSIVKIHREKWTSSFCGNSHFGMHL